MKRNINNLCRDEIAQLTHQHLLYLEENLYVDIPDLQSTLIGKLKLNRYLLSQNDYDNFFGKVSKWNLRYKSMDIFKIFQKILRYIESDMVSARISSKEYSHIFNKMGEYVEIYNDLTNAYTAHNLKSILSSAKHLFAIKDICFDEFVQPNVTSTYKELLQEYHKTGESRDDILEFIEKISIDRFTTMILYDIIGYMVDEFNIDSYGSPFHKKLNKKRIKDIEEKLGGIFNILTSVKKHK